MDGNAQPEHDRQPALRRRLRHLGQGTLSVEGVTGTVYRFHGHGAVQKVEAEDAPALLQLMREHRGCCGNSQVWQEQLLVEVRD